MGVTRKPPEAALNRLIAFLNFAYPERTREKFMQKEAKRRLMPLLSPLTPEVLEFHLAGLIAEINKMELRPHWVITSAEIVNRSEKSNGLRHGERVVRVQNTYWVLSKVPLAVGQRESVYYDIVRSIEEGDFGRLRICSKCQRFFAANDFRENLCGDSCRNLAKTSTARDRMARLRKRRKDTASKTTQANHAKREKASFQKFVDFMTQRSNRQLTDERMKFIDDVRRKLPGRNETLNQWDKRQKKGESLRNIWLGLPSETREIF